MLHCLGTEIESPSLRSTGRDNSLLSGAAKCEMEIVMEIKNAEETPRNICKSLMNCEHQTADEEASSGGRIKIQRGDRVSEGTREVFFNL